MQNIENIEEDLRHTKNWSFRRFLQNEFLERIERNSQYSLRAFAQFLILDPSSLSQILRGKRNLSDPLCKRLALRLGLSPKEFSDIQSPQQHKGYGDLEILQEDHFRVISDWYHYAILELTNLKSFQPNPKWIAQTLGLSLPEVNLAVERLVRLNFLNIDESGVWTDCLGDVRTTGNEFTTPANRKLQKQILEGAIMALEKIPQVRRKQTSLTFPGNSKSMKQAKELMDQFIGQLSSLLKSEKEYDEVYQVSFSLYPVTQISKTNSKQEVEDL